MSVAVPIIYKFGFHTPRVAPIAVLSVCRQAQEAPCDPANRHAYAPPRFVAAGRTERGRHAASPDAYHNRLRPSISAPVPLSRPTLGAGLLTPPVMRSGDRTTTWVGRPHHNVTAPQRVGVRAPCAGRLPSAHAFGLRLDEDVPIRTAQGINHPQHAKTVGDHAERRAKERLHQRPPLRRPFYPPTERTAILDLRAARGWSLEQTARTFQVTAATSASWMKRLEENGPDELVRVRQPVALDPPPVGFRFVLLLGFPSLLTKRLRRR
jgi:hypothetical protein